MVGLVRHVVLRLLLVGLASLAAVCGSAPVGAADLTRFDFTQIQMGVSFTVSLYATDLVVANRAADAAFARIKQLNDLFTDYDPKSELMRFCREAEPGRMYPISPELWDVFQASQRFAEQSDGAFDITVGPYVRLWRRARKLHELPSAGRLAEARPRVGFRLLSVDPTRPQASLAVPGMRLDLGGIAKGYAADEAIRVLKEQGIDRALVAASGDIRVSDPPPGRAGWRVGVASLDAEKGEPSRYLTLQHAAVSTSGDAFQFVEIEGRRYSHIVDPRTGIGLTDRMSVTVIAPNGMTSDALATAACVLGLERGFKLIESIEGVEAFAVRMIDGQLQTRETPGFASLEDSTKE
ncbi:MAG: FAD:protein FMN transferase [Pirellulales bacterium]|nr:FAD:protein FMN transferase [Pirellulales bacterium]